MSEYAEFLKTKIFKTDEYHQFSLLFDQLTGLDLKGRNVAILERSQIYGGKSIFAALVRADSITAIDYRNQSADEREGYQAEWLATSGFAYLQSTQAIRDRGTHHDFTFKTLPTDVLLIPNVLHHCRDFSDVLASLIERMPDLGAVHIFDSYLRENHQVPDDFCRYTPSALTDIMGRNGFTTTKVEEAGNVFDAILYFISQAKVVLQRDELADLRELIEETLVPRLRDVRTQEDYRGLGRKYAFAATSYAMSFERQ